jgi:phosphoglycolate phosphatase
MALSKDALNDIQLLVFDLDGTLIDSKEDLALSVNAMRDWMGLPRLPNETVASYVGQGVPTLIRRALANGAADEVTAEAVQKATAFFLDYYRGHMLDHTVAYDGVREALEELKDRKLAVLTNKPVVFSRAILAGLKLADYFAFVYGGNSFEQKKPDPVGVIKLMSDTGVGPRETVMVGDSETDVLTGRNAGVWTCGVTYGLGSHTLERTAPDVLVGDLRDLPPLLNGQKQVESRKSKVKEQK